MIKMTYFLASLFTFCLLTSFVAFIIGIIKPALVIRWGSKRTRGKALLIYGSLSLFSLVMIGVTTPPVEKKEKKVDSIDQKIERLAEQSASFSDSLVRHSKKQVTLDNILPIEPKKELKPKESIPQAKIEQKSPTISQTFEWLPASGNFWSGVKLYYGPKKMYVGEVYCANNNYIDPHTGHKFRGIKILYPSGNMEWKDRNAIILSNNWFVRSDDPALERMEYYECEF